MNPMMPKNIQFRVETMFINSRVGRIKPDENNVYKGLPMMVLGETTQNNTYYDPQSLVRQIQDPNTNFAKVMKRQQLYGEYGHPVFIGMNDQEKIQRLMTVDEKQVSHLFTGLYTDAPTAAGTVVLRADIKPMGPYGATLKESLDDPLANTAFSLRSFVNTDIKPNGLKYRTVRQLTTWDTVGTSGYASTDKAHGIGLESFAGDTHHEYEIHVMASGNLVIDQIALEHFTATDMNEIFGASSISQVVQSRTFVKVDEAAQRYPNLYAHSVFHDFLKEGPSHG